MTINPCMYKVNLILSLHPSAHVAGGTYAAARAWVVRRRGGQGHVQIQSPCQGNAIPASISHASQCIQRIFTLVWELIDP